MLKQYRRHTNQCVKGYKQHDCKQANCKCMVYVEGRLTRTSPYIKESTGTRSWEEARRMIVAAEQRGSWLASVNATESESNQESPNSRPSIAAAVDAFLSEAGSEKGRNLAPANILQIQ